MTQHRAAWFRGTRRMGTMFAAVAIVNGCASASSAGSPSNTAATAGTPPSYVLGSFIDDYGGHHTISSDEWKQGDEDRYHIVRWNSDGRYLIAENSNTSPASLGRWTRIDWVRLDNLPPYAWAFCFSAYEMKTAAAAESAMVAKVETPRNGCNGYPFTRMRAVSER